MYLQNKSLTCGQYVPDNAVLNKKVPGNPKYQHVKPAIDTGHSVRRHIDGLKEKQKNCHHKKDEVFNRIKFVNFIELIIEAAKIKLKAESFTGDSMTNDDETSDQQIESKCLANVIMGIGEIDIANERKKLSSPVPKLEKEYPYLLLDVRDKDQFLECHIKTANHYPSALLTRSIGYETEELKLYKNCSPEVIILYDDDESIAARVATTLVQRGYDNIFLLTGGLKYCQEVFPRKPMSNLCTSLPPDPNQSASPVVQVKNALTAFSQEDINTIEEYMDFPRKECSRPYTRSCSSYSKSEKCSEKKPIGTSGTRSASQIFRRNSGNSMKSIEHVKLKNCLSATDNRKKGAKKVPWK